MARAAALVVRLMLFFETQGSGWNSDGEALTATDLLSGLCFQNPGLVGDDRSQDSIRVGWRQRSPSIAVSLPTPSILSPLEDLHPG
jgi:hypothetical protein